MLEAAFENTNRSEELTLKWKLRVAMRLLATRRHQILHTDGLTVEGSYRQMAT